MKMQFGFARQGAAVAVLCGVGAVAFPAVAQETEPESVIIVTAVGAPQSADDSGASVSVIDEEAIRARQSIAVADLLRDLPGVNVVQSGGLGSQTSVRFRGAEADQTLVLIDGIRVNDPSAPDGSFDFGTLLSGNIERIEVLRGANSVAFGSQALGGVVNITTARPTDRLNVFASGEYGARDTLRLASHATDSFGPLGLAVGGSYAETDGFSAFDRGTERDGFRQHGANGSAQLRISAGLRAEASIFYSDSRVDNDNVFPPFSGDNAQFSAAQEIYGRFAVEADVAGGRWRNRFAFTLADINRVIDSPFFIARPNGRTERFEYQGDFQLSDSARLVFGSEREDSRYEESGTRDDTGITSLYLQGIFRPIAPLSLTVGTRQDDHDDFGGNTSFAANLAYELAAEGPVVRASYAEGFRAPSLIDLDGSPFGFGSPDLRPETARSYELGVSDDWLADRVSGAVTLFRRDTDDQIAFAACPPPPEPAPAICTAGLRPFGTTQNIERTRTSGIEAAIAVRPDPAIELSANYTYLDTRNRSTGRFAGNRLARRPIHALYLNAGWAFVPEALLSADLQLVGDSFDDVANSRRLDGYALAGVRVQYPIAAGIEFFGRIENLFDVDYRTATDFGTPGRSAFAGLRTRF